MGLPAVAVVALALTAALLQPGAAVAAGAAAARCQAEDVRWASSSNRLYVTGPVTCTLAELKQHRPKAPLAQVSPGVWELGASIHVEDGARLDVHGARHGGDVREVRLISGGGGFVLLRAHWGTLDFRGVKVTSWDPEAGKPDTDLGDGRAYVHVRSMLDPDGATPRESRMNIVDSDMGHLGYAAAESYGLSWKVSGEPTPELFAAVDVGGEVVRSRLHHNYFGAYTYGAHGMRFTGNEVDHNLMYGIDPHDDSDQLVIRGNHTHSNGNHGIICSKRCDGLVIEDNRTENNEGNGIMLHRDVTASVVRDNHASGNGDAGIAVFDSHRNVIQDNVLTGNRYGIRLSVGAEGNQVRGNEIHRSRKHGLYFYKGSDEPLRGDGRPKGNRFIGNVIDRSAEYAVNLGNADENVFTRNRIGGENQRLRLRAGRGNRISGLEAPAGTLVETLGTPRIKGQTRISGVRDVTVKGNTNSETVLSDPDGQVFTIGGGVDATTVTTRLGSEVVLEGEQISEGVDVTGGTLWALPHHGRARITAAAADGQGVRWTVRADSATQPIRWTVGGAETGRTYTVTRDGEQVAELRAGGGTLRFTGTPGKRHEPVTYEVLPA